MKAITTNNINGSILQGGNIMNLISNIFVKNYDINRSADESKRTNMNQDRGYNLYRALEFKNDNPNKTGHNLYMEMICNRLL